KCPPSNAPSSSSAAASSTRPRGQETCGPRRTDPYGQFSRALRLGQQRAELRRGVHLRVHAADPGVHHHVLGAAPVLALAEPHPAVPLRRLRAVPAAVPAYSPELRSARSLAGRGRPLPRHFRAVRELAAAPLALKRETDGTHARRERS